VGVDACGVLSTSVGQTNRKLKYGGHSAYKMQKSTENVAKSPKCCTLTGNQAQGIERCCLNLHRKFISNRFCACTVQMLLQIVVNATICCSFEAQYTVAARGCLPPGQTSVLPPPPIRSAIDILMVTTMALGWTVTNRTLSWGCSCVMQIPAESVLQCER